MSLSYDAIAERYDELYGEEQEEKYSMVLSKINISGLVVLDAGCGTGLLIPRLDRVEYYVGIDFSKEMIRRSTLRLKGTKVFGDLVMGDVGLMPFRDSSFEASFSFTVVHEAPGLLPEIVRVTKKGGLISVTLLKKKGHLEGFILSHLTPNNKIIAIDKEKTKDLIYVVRKSSYD